MSQTEVSQREAKCGEESRVLACSSSYIKSLVFIRAAWFLLLWKLMLAADAQRLWDHQFIQAPHTLIKSAKFNLSFGSFSPVQRPSGVLINSL